MTVQTLVPECDLVPVEAVVTGDCPIHPGRSGCCSVDDLVDAGYSVAPELDGAYARALDDARRLRGIADDLEYALAIHGAGIAERMLAEEGGAE